MQQIKGFKSPFLPAPVLQDDLPAAPERHTWRHAPVSPRLSCTFTEQSTDVQPRTATWHGFSPSFDAQCGGALQPRTATWHGFSPSFDAQCGGAPPSDPVPVRRFALTDRFQSDPVPFRPSSSSAGPVYGHTLRPAGCVGDLPHAKAQHEGRSHSTQHKQIGTPEEADPRAIIEADKLRPPRSVELAQLESLFAAMERDIAEVANHGVAKVNSLPFKDCLHVSRCWLPFRHKVAEARAGKKKKLQVLPQLLD